MDDTDSEIQSALAELRRRRGLRALEDLRERHAREPWCGPGSQCRWVRTRVALILEAGLARELAEMEVTR